jgi:hypothetical protein
MGPPAKPASISGNASGRGSNAARLGGGTDATEGATGADRRWHGEDDNNANNAKNAKNAKNAMTDRSASDRGTVTAGATTVGGVRLIDSSSPGETRGQYATSAIARIRVRSGFAVPAAGSRRGHGRHCGYGSTVAREGHL